METKQVIAAINKFNEKFAVTQPKSIDVSSILKFDDCLDNPSLLNKNLADIPAIYAYWSSLARESKQILEEAKTQVSIWESNKMDGIISILNGKGIKTPTQKAIDAEFKNTFETEEEYINLNNSVKSANEVYEKIDIVVSAIRHKMDALRVIASLVTNMMQTGLFLNKPAKSGGF